jgi:hypothetical protein
MPFEFANPLLDPEHPEQGSAGAMREELWLLGQPPLADFIDQACGDAEGGDEISRAVTIDTWRTANDHLAGLEKTEAGAADRIRCRKLPAPMAGAAEILRGQDLYRNTFDKVPTTIEMVELDRIVASQRHVTLPFVQSLARQLDPSLRGADLFRFCQPLERRDAGVTIRRLGRDRYAFLSESTDLRYHQTHMLRPDQVSGLCPIGPIAGIVGVAVGHGSNFLSGIRWGKRIVLHNGYHRACALRMAGVRYAPLIIQNVTRRDELEAIAASAVVDDPAFYFRANRPPMLKDFFDPRTSMVLPVRRKRKMIEVSISVTELDVEDL